MTMPSLPGGDTGVKGFWKRPEGKTAGIINIILLGVGIYFWGSIVPFVLSAAEDTLHLIIVAIAIVALLMLVTSKKVHYIGRSIARFITSWFVEIDPIGILKTYVEKLQSKKEELESATGEIRGLRIKLNQRLHDNQAAYNKSMSDLQTANATLSKSSATDDQRRLAQRILASESKHSDGLADLISKQQAHLARYDLVVNVLSRYGEVCDDTILDIKRDVDLKEQEREESRGFNKGMRAAFGIIRGFGDEREMYDMSMDTLEQQYTQKMGEVENFLDLTKGVIAKADFNDEAALADVTAKLDKWKGQNQDMQLGRGASKQQMLDAASPSIDTSVAQNKPVSIDEYFK